MKKRNPLALEKTLEDYASSSRKNQEDGGEFQAEMEEWEPSNLRPGEYEWICSVCQKRNFQTRKLCRRRNCQGFQPEWPFTDDQEEEEEEEEKEGEESDRGKGCLKKEGGGGGGGGKDRARQTYCAKSAE